MGSSKAPKPADTAGAARAEAQGNKEVAQYTGALDRPTQIDPYGTLSWEYKPGGLAGLPDTPITPHPQQAFLDHLKRVAAGQEGSAADRSWIGSSAGQQLLQQTQQQVDSHRMAQGGGGTMDKPLPGEWIQRLTLSPEQQAILNAEQSNDLALQQLASQGVDIAKGTLGTQFNPQLQGLDGLGALGLSEQDLPQFMASLQSMPQFARSNVSLASLGLQPRQTGLPQNRLNQLKMLGESTEQFSAERQQAIDAMYEQMTRFSGERFGKEEEAERARLANTGLMPGSEAYNRAMSEFRRSKDESYRGAELQSILAGGAEQSRLQQDLLGTRASNIGLGQAQFGQDASRAQLDLAERQARQAAQAQMYGMGLDERQTAFQSGMQQYGMGLDERQAQFGAGINRYQVGLGERQAQQQSQMNQLTWDAQRRQQQFQEAAYQRSLPLNEITALMGGSGVNLPQFQPFNQQQSWQGPQLMDAELARAGQDQASANAANARRGQTTAAIGTVALTAAMMF